MEDMKKIKKRCIFWHIWGLGKGETSGNGCWVDSKSDTSLLGSGMGKLFSLV